jgi:hypothetical protein
MREAFEKDYVPHQLRIDTSGYYVGQYVSSSIEREWQKFKSGWQAALSQPHDNKEADSQINLSEDDLLKIVSDYVKKEPLAEGVNAFHVKVIYNALINSAKKE